MSRYMPAVAFALPGTVLACTLAVHVILAAGWAPMWSEDRVNISEAEALQDGATVMHMMRRGESARERHLVRAGILSDEAVWLTPLEAGIAARRPDVVELVLKESRGIDWTTWSDAKCLADDTGIERVIDAYRPAMPPGVALDCPAMDRPGE